MRRGLVLTVVALVVIGLGIVPTAVSADDEWADDTSCEGAELVAADGKYEGTINTPEDNDAFRIKLEKGDYITISSFVPNSAEEFVVSVYADPEHTFRKLGSLDATGWQVETEAGVENTWEMWAEESGVFCFFVQERQKAADIPYKWELGLSKNSPDANRVVRKYLPL